MNVANGAVLATHNAARQVWISRTSYLSCRNHFGWRYLKTEEALGNGRHRRGVVQHDRGNRGHCGGTQFWRLAMKNMTQWLFPLLLVCGSGVCMAQSTNSGDIRGSVTDATGALIPNVTVTVMNVDTGVSKDYTTNLDGLYDTSSIVAGSYTVTFTREGFEQLVRGPITLQVGVTTVNGQLKVGSAKEQVTVNTDVPLLQTESGEQTVTWDSQTMDAMPEVSGIQGEDWGNQVVFLPGMSGTPTGAYGVTMMQQWGSANGSLPYNNILEDGASNSLGGSMIASDATLDTVAELQVSLSNFSAQYGSGGVVINQITKGGTSKFHGAGYDFLQNDKLNAAEYGFGNTVPIPYIRFNNFGGDVSGPILRRRCFSSSTTTRLSITARQATLL